MSESDDSKKVSNNDLRNSQISGSIINSDTLHANQIGNNTFNININDSFQLQQIFQEFLVAKIEKSVTLPEKDKKDVIGYFNQNKNSEINGKDNLLSIVEKIGNSETIYSHYLIAKYLETNKARCNLTMFAIASTLRNIDINKFYKKDENVYKAVKVFCDLLFVCLEWLYNSVKSFSALRIKDKDKKRLSSCPYELMEYAFGVLKKEAEGWTENAEVAKEVEIYLNLLLRQIYD